MKQLNQQRLLAMLTTKRPAYSLVEEQFCADWLDTIDGMQCDTHGNRWIVVGDPRTTTTMFSSHTDTVHREMGEQNISFDTHTGDIFLSDTKAGNCLGADDTVGVALMLEMFERRVPGLYVWHRGEEVGGQGSEYLASTDEPGILGKIQRCIAFDRLGTSSIITHQMGGRCCSDAFGKNLMMYLQRYMPQGKYPVWELDEGGVFTDSANYTHLIPECTNLSVGYWNQHTRAEFCNAYFLEDLLGACLRTPWDSLPTVRVPAVDDYTGMPDYTGGWPTFHSWEDAYSYTINHPEDAASLLMEVYSDRWVASEENDR